VATFIANNSKGNFKLPGGAFYLLSKHFWMRLNGKVGRTVFQEKHREKVPYRRGLQGLTALTYIHILAQQARMECMRWWWKCKFMWEFQ